MSIRSDEKSVVLLKIEILWRELIMKFSDRLKGLREKNDMTQEQLAKVSGVSPRTIQRYECGTSRPRLDAAEKLAKALNISVDQLLGDRKSVV